MTELYRHIGPDTDVPAGDIGVGGREVGYLFGHFKRLVNAFVGTLTGKGATWGGSLLRPEATGYGCVYLVEEMMKTRGDGLTGKRVSISGSGNVAQYAAEKCIELGGKVLTLSDSEGYIVDEAGLDLEKWRFVMDLKNERRGRIREYVKKYPGAKFFEGRGVWSVPCDVALPCATQNELDESDAKTLVKNRCQCVAEGANMPSTPEAADVFVASKVLFAPGKAANAGGVAVSGLEMSQNSTRASWTRDEVDARLRGIMKSIHTACVKTAAEFDKPGNYIIGANIAGFRKVADAMLDQGVG
jgi:glutamate dehydrogenase (NADP+)